MGYVRSGRIGRGWYYPAKVTGLFLVLATLAMTLLAHAGVNHFRDGNAGQVEVRLDRATRSAAALAIAADPDLTVTRSGTGSPIRIVATDPDTLEPSAMWNGLVDTVGQTNQGAANLFRWDDDAEAFDRIATSFRKPDGSRVGDSQVEAGLIGAGHPAWNNLVAGIPYRGEVPVDGRLRFAALTPIVDEAGTVVGALAVDLGWVDDLNLLNDEVGRTMWLLTIALLASTAIAAILLMLWAFRPLNQLINVAEEISVGDVSERVPLTDRRGEIGVLANALARTSELQADLTSRATTDQLTGLANRASFMAELTRRLSAAEAANASCALLLIDLDQFKEVNDGFGHPAGDELLITIAATLTSTLQPGEYLARLGGDEFALLTAAVDAEIDADEVAHRVTQAVAGVASTSVAEIGVTCSIGIVLLPQQADTAALALSHADLALYRVKRGGRAHWQFFQSSLEAGVLRRIHLTTELRRALRDDDIEVEFQPIFDRGATRIIGLEALARWNHPSEGRIPPQEFISAAENGGLINEVGNRIFELACGFAANLRLRGLPAPTVSVNVSTIQLWQRDFYDRVVESLRRHQLPWNAICLEITESVVVHHADRQSRQLLQRLIHAGVRLSIDDFGTGYSALSYLRDLDVHQLKVDRLFVAGAVESDAGRRLFQGIVSLGQSLGLQVVAEGVETEAELAMARTVGCDALQGYLLGYPLTADAVRELLTEVAPAELPTRGALPRRRLTSRQVVPHSVG